jgi:hypothetical protein
MKIAILNKDVFPLGIPEIVQALAKCLNARAGVLRITDRHIA